MGDIDAPVIRVVSRLADYDADQWNACAHPPDTPYNPFLSHAFLMALEESGSACADTGWLPQHLVVETPAGDSLGAMPLYLKSHSQGEYIFDYGWADAFHRAGGRYYPKLLSAVPFTPATGPRLLIRDPARADAIMRALVGGALTLSERLEASSLHINFLPEPQWAALGELDFLQRTDQQFHWVNDGYESFDAFLAALASRKRKNLKKERARAVDNGIEIEQITGLT